MAILGLSVPDGKYCWNDKIPKVCRYFRNEGGKARCKIFPYAEIKDVGKKYPMYRRPKCCASKLRSR